MADILNATIFNCDLTGCERQVIVAVPAVGSGRYDTCDRQFTAVAVTVGSPIKNSTTLAVPHRLNWLWPLYYDTAGPYEARSRATYTGAEIHIQHPLLLSEQMGKVRKCRIVPCSSEKQSGYKLKKNIVFHEWKCATTLLNCGSRQKRL